MRVKAAGVGPWDAWIRAGKSALPQPLPLTLGSDLSGVVVRVGPDVTGFQPGDEIYGVTNPRFIGAYADYAIASAAMIARKPGSLTHVDAASVPVIAVTAWQALFEHAGLVRGQSVLIHGSAGSVGAFTVQLAHQAGLRVIATCGQGDVAYVRALGADEILPREGQAFEEVVHDIDADAPIVERDPAVDDDRLAARDERQSVHPDLAEPTERDHLYSAGHAPSLTTRALCPTGMTTRPSSPM